LALSKPQAKGVNTPPLRLAKNTTTTLPTAVEEWEQQKSEEQMLNADARLVLLGCTSRLGGIEPWIAETLHKKDSKDFLRGLIEENGPYIWFASSSLSFSKLLKKDFRLDIPKKPPVHDLTCDTYIQRRHVQPFNK
jgi:hypothetical protein